MNEPNWTLSRKRQTLTERARIIQNIRSFFIDRGYLEVETPRRIPANAPEPHIDAVASGVLCVPLYHGLERGMIAKTCQRMAEANGVNE